MLGGSEEGPTVPDGSSPFCWPPPPSNPYPALAQRGWCRSGNGRRRHLVESVSLLLCALVLDLLCLWQGRMENTALSMMTVILVTRD